MATEHLLMVYETIETIVKKNQRHLMRGIQPKDVVSRLPYRRAEGSVRRDMLDMCRNGLLVRVGGGAARQGYRVPTLVERVCFDVTKCWPYGCERALSATRFAATVH